MELGLKGKTALVLGSSQGLGLGIANALLNEGARVAILGRRKEMLQTLAHSLSEKYATQVIAIHADLSQNESEIFIQEAIEKHFGHLDILINNTGGPPMIKTGEITQEQWLQYFHVMFLRLVSITQTYLPAMIAQKWGRILNIASSGVIEPIPNLSLSNTLRSALAAWSKTLSMDIAPHGVTINTLVPGKIETERLYALQSKIAAFSGKSIDVVKVEAMQKIPMQRFGQVEEFADMATFLVSAKASYITGSVIRVDGGLLKSQ